jgi:nucleoside permease NupC
MDITTSFFWQNVLLLLLLTPYVVGIAISAFYTNKPTRAAALPTINRPALEKPGDAARPAGRLLAAIGATLLALVFSITSVVAVCWALVTLVGLPQFILWALLVLCLIPVAWVTAWTAGRAWHVEQLLEKGSDTDQPAFELCAYLPLPFLQRRHL